jgi:hypothetical protein
MYIDELIDRCSEVLEQHKKKSGEHLIASLQAELER